MKRSRFLVVVTHDGRRIAAVRDALGRALARVGPFACSWSGRRAVMFVDGQAIALAHGAIAGTIVRTGGAQPVTSLSEKAAAAVAESFGQTLVATHWGGYVALTERDSNVAVLRSPLGDLPCLFATCPDGLALASDVALLELAGCSSAIDYAALARHLAAPDVRRPETCLAGISELQGGKRLIIADGQCRTEVAWSPWAFADRERQIADVASARRVVRHAIAHAVTATSRGHGKVVLRLSGGLDSSIVAVSLAAAEVPSVALNLVTTDAAGDERDYARIAARTAGMELVERVRLFDTIDVTLSAAATLPRPSARAFVQESMRHARSLADDCGATALIDGGGGDNVFCSLQSIRPVVDCLWSRTGWRRSLDTARSIATLAQVSQSLVLRRAIGARLHGLSRFSFPLDIAFLSRDAVAAAQGAADHDWLDSPPGALPGKAAHVGLIAAAQSVVEGFDPLDAIPLVSPLISQPVVEACLAVPSWLWYEAGHNRAVARGAFADILPPSIAWRRSKGGPDGFIAELYRRNRSTIAASLMDGVLMANGVLDRATLERALAERGPVQSHDFIRILQLMDAEAWARCRTR